MTSKPKILYVIGGLSIGGTERHLSQILPALHHRGWEMMVVRIGDSGPMDAFLEEVGIEVRAADLTPIFNIPKIAGISILLRQIWVCRRIAQEFRPDILHSFLGTPTIIAGAVNRFVGAKFISSKRNQMSRPDAFYGEGKLERLSIKGADLVMAHSSVVRDEIADLGIPFSKIPLVHNGIEVELYFSKEKERGLLRQKFGWENQVVLTMVANLIPYKGHEYLLRSLSGIVRSHPDLPPWRLVLAGDGPNSYKDHLGRLIQEGGLDERVQLLGHRADVQDILAASDIGLLLSRHEGFSNALLEYSASQLPTIATAVGGNLDSVISGKTGFLVPSENTDALSEALVGLISNEVDRQQMGHSARELVKSQFSLQHCIRGYEKVYSTFGMNSA